jgi:LmbE family N-acetylglucosaminyl deacetylase
MRLLLCLALVAAPAFAAEPLPEDRGTAGVHQALKRLGTTARVLYITAHPDDEDGGTITWLTRGLGVDVTLLSLTRGESGANLITGDFFDSLGALRTLELLRAAQYYGCRVRFTNHIDYGYSKNVGEAWRNWDREKLLGEVVRIVREEKPHVIIGRWQGNARDGHGHHSAAGVMAQLAFAAAGDPARFPGQLEPWQALKLYGGNRRETDEWTIAVDSGQYDPVLGRSYAQIARDGLRWQRSQGAGAVVSRPGPQIGYYQLLASKLPGNPVKEKSFLEGLEDQVQYPAASTPADIARGLATVRSPRQRERWQQALNLALGVEVEALVQPDQPGTVFRPYETFAVATPGQSFDVLVKLHARAPGVNVQAGRLELVAPAGWKIVEKSAGLFTVTAPADAQPTAAHWRRDSVRELTYSLDDAARFGQPLPAAPLIARAHYQFNGVQGVAEREPLVSSIDTLGVQQLRPLAVGPALAIRFTTDAGVLPADRDRYSVRAVVRNVSSKPVAAAVRLDLPSGWRSEPAQADVRFEKEGEETSVPFLVIAPANAPDATITAVASAAGREYRSDFQPHTYTNLDTLYLLRPARHTIRRVDVKVAPGIRVGYVTGTGDDVPRTLDQLGVPYDLLDTSALATGDLSKYSTILLGIRAYAARTDVKTYNQRLLDYVAQGGVLVVQYNTPEYDNNYGPFPYSMGRNPEEVSEENAAVTILDPSDAVFQRPNRITTADFDGWVEQRGSKFLATWATPWKPLIETHDTGQEPQKGAWLVARHGKGLYVYCALAWYRQLPFAVPGAVRLFANLISLPAEVNNRR